MVVGGGVGAAGVVGEGVEVDDCDALVWGVGVDWDVSVWGAEMEGWDTSPWGVGID